MLVKQKRDTQMKEKQTRNAHLHTNLMESKNFNKNVFSIGGNIDENLNNLFSGL